MPPRGKKQNDSANGPALLNAALKSGEFADVYLLYGEEDHLKSLYSKKLIEAVSGGNEMNVTRLNGETATPEQVIEGAQILPFFAEKRLIVVEDSGWFAGASDGALADFIGDLPDTACLIFVEKNVNKTTRLFKACAKAGTAVELGAQGEDTLITWIARKLKAEGKNIRQATAEKILSYVGPDMNRLGQELAKLAAYTGKRTVVEDADVDAVCVKTISAYVFDMTDAMIDGRKDLAFAIFFDLLAMKESPQRIINVIGKQFARLAETAMCMEAGMGRDQIAGELDVQPWLAGRLMRQAGRSGHERFLRAVDLSLQSIEDIVTGRIEDQVACEALIAEA